MAGRLPREQADLLKDELRCEIVRHIEDHPGITPEDLRAHFALTKGVMNHHRRVLVEAGILHERRQGRRVVLTAWTSRTPTTATVRGTARKVAVEVEEAGVQGLTAEEVSARLGVPKRTASHHLRKLALVRLVIGSRTWPNRYRATDGLRKILAVSSDSGLD